MRALALLSAVAVTASLAVAIPGSVSEEAALASTPSTCESIHGTAAPALVDGSYVIDSVQKLVYLSVNQNTGSPAWRTRNFIQTAPIDLDGCLWAPIGTEADPFVGTFDGNNLTITGLQLDNTTNDFGDELSSSPPRGLFGVVGSDGTLTNVRIHSFSFVSNRERRDLGALAGKVIGGTIENSHVEGTTLQASVNSVRVGGLVGDLRDGGTIRNSSSQINVSAGNATGGLVGQSTNGTIEDSFATGNVEGLSSVGGLVGSANSSSEIRRSYASGNVTATGNFIGGLIGETGGSTPNTIQDSFATGNVASSSDNVGGLVGDARQATISRSYSTGTVTGNNNVGGLIGFSQDSTVTVSDSFWNINTSGKGDEDGTTGSAGGVGKTTEQLTTLSTFTDTDTVGLNAPWPIVDGWESFAPDADPARVWGIRSVLNDGYPYFLWEYETEDECAFVHGTAEPAKQGDDYVIASAGNLVYLSVNQGVNVPGTSDPWRTRNFIQTAPIDLQECLWTPIGADGAAFTGQYDGGGFPIDNLTISSGDSRGLFGVTRQATIAGVHLLNASLEVGEWSGTLVGQALDTTISDSSATGSIYSIGNNVGGLVGLANASSISRSYSAISVDGTGGVYGGLVGFLEKSTIDSSFATGAVSSPNTGGGLVGQVNNEPNYVSNSYARGAVTGAFGVGGLIGNLIGTSGNPTTLEVTNSYATGKVVSTEGQVGGLIGDKADDGVTFTVTNSFWDKDTTERETTLDNKGSGETTTAMKTLSTFEGAGWSIASCRTTGEDTVWGIVASGYPFLSWQDTPQLAACTTTAEPSSPSTRPRPTPEPISLEPVAPVVPQQFGGASATVGDNDADPESTLDLPVTVDEATEPETEDAGGSPAVAGSDSDTDASGVGQASDNSTWLLVIGLSGLGAAALIAGGVAFARLRP